MKLLWEDRAWNDYLYWQTQDKKTLKRINMLIKDIQRSPYEVNRIVYYEQAGIIYIISCLGHYHD